MNYKSFILLLFIVVFPASIFGQVTIGSGGDPEKAALLDIKTQSASVLGGATTNTGGLLLPRVELQSISELAPFPVISESNYQDEKKKHKGLMVFNIAEVPSQNLEIGVYVWDGDKWNKGAGKSGRRDFFYMPSIPIQTSQNVTIDAPIDLYGLYKEQFSNPKVKSTNAPNSILYYTQPTDLYYYVTDYDESVFENVLITVDGKLTYDVISPSTSCSYMNIVFVTK